MDAIVPDLGAAALDHVDLDLVAVVVVIEMIVTVTITTVVIVAIVEAVAGQGREVVIVAGGDLGVDLVRTIGGGAEVQGQGLIVAVAAMIVGEE